MISDIDLVRVQGAYRLLHGHLRLVTAASQQDEVLVDVPGEGPVRIVRTPQGYFVGKDGAQLPIVHE